MPCDFMVATVTGSVAFQPAEVKMNASFGVLKYETWYKSITGTRIYFYDQEQDMTFLWQSVFILCYYIVLLVDMNAL
jgi:hypothetical protein